MTSKFLSLVSHRLGIPNAKLPSLCGGHAAHVYRFEQDGRKLVLRLIPSGEDMDLQAQQAIMAWVTVLSENGAAVAASVPLRDEKLVEVIPGEGGDWLAVVFEHALGVLSETLKLEKRDAPLIQVFGQAVGKMHTLAKKYIPSAGLRRPDWDAGGNPFNPPALNQVWLKEKQASVLDRIHILPSGGEEYPLILSDLHFGNFFVDPVARVITLFDFDDCCHGWSVMDTAVLLFDILVLYEEKDRDVFARHFMRHFFSRYKTENPIDIFWVTQIPLFLKLLEINLYDDVAPYYDPKGRDSWVSKFIPGRKERIESNLPYVDVDFENLILTLSGETPLEEEPYGG